MALTTITKDFVVKSGLRVEGSSSVTTSTAGIGTLSVNGGAAVAGNIIVGSSATLYGATTIQNILNVAGDVTVNSGKAVIASATGDIYTQGNVGVQGTFNSTGTISINNLFTVNGTTGNLATQGTLYASGDAGVGGAFNSTGTLSVNNLFSVNGTTGNLFAKGTGYFGSDVGVQGTFNSTGTFTVNSDKFTVAAATGNTTAKGTLSADGDFSVNTDKFTVAATTGNTNAKGTLKADGDFAINTDKFTVNATTGNTTAAGTVAINSTQAVAQDGSAGALVVQGGAYVGDQLYVANTATFGKDVYIGGALYVGGSQTVIDSVVVTTGDKVIYVSTGSSTAATATGAGLAVGSTASPFITFEYDGSLGNGGRANFVSSGGLIADVSAGSTATVLANAIIAANGGIGANGDSFIDGSLAVSGVVYGTTTQANNLNRGGANQVAYQTGAGVTDFVAAPSADNQVLTYTETNGLYWGAASATSVGRATTATNIDGGSATQIPFQTAAGVTGFDSVFTYDSGTNELVVNNATLSGGSTVTLSNTNGGGTELYSTDYAQLNYDNTNYVYARNDGVWLETIGGDYSLNLDTAGNLTLNGGGTFEALYVKPSNLTSGSVTYYDGSKLVDSTNLTFDGSTLSAAHVNPTNLTNNGVTYYDGYTLVDSANLTFDGTTVAAAQVKPSNLTSGRVTYYDGSKLVDDSGLTYASGALTVGSSLTVSGTGGDITLTGGNVAGAANITGTGTVQGGHLKDTSLTVDGGLVYTDATGQLVDSSSLTYASSTLTTPKVSATNTSPTLGGSAAGALSVSGGANIAKDLYVGSTATIAGTLFVDSDVTINADLYVEGTIFVKGSELSGLDQISGSTATFADLSVTNAATVQDFTVLGNFSVNGYSLGHFADITSTGTAYLNNVSITGTTDATTLALSSNLDNGYGFNNDGSTSTVAWSVATAGGIYAFKNITAGGVVSAGDATTVKGNDTGSVDAFYAVNNIQAARTIKSISGSAKKEIDRWSKTKFTSAKYLVQIVDAGDIYVSEFMIVTDGTANNYISEYGNISNNGDLGTFSVSDSGDNLIFSFTPAGATSMTIQVVRQSILTAMETFGAVA